MSSLAVIRVDFVLKKLATDILERARLEIGRIETEDETVRVEDVNEVIEKLIAEMRE